MANTDTLVFIYSESAEKHSGGALNVTKEKFMINLALSGRSDLAFLETSAISSKIAAVLAEVQSATVLHISSHGNAHGLRFEETFGAPSYLAPKDELGLYITRCRPQLLVLSACNSLELGKFACTLAVPHVIATTSVVPDDVARNFMSRFYETISDPTGRVTVQEAFRLARLRVDDDPSFVLLPERGLGAHDVPLFRPLQSQPSLCPSNLPPKPDFAISDIMIDPLEQVRLLGAEERVERSGLCVLLAPLHPRHCVSQIYLAFQTEGYRFRAVVVAGEAHGVGSSFVALHAAHHLRERSCFPGGVVWVPPAEGLSLLQRVGRAIGAPAASAADIDVSSVRARLRGCPRRLLIVLDNIDACPCFVRSLRGLDEAGPGSGADVSPRVSCSAACTSAALRELLGASDAVHALVVTTDDASLDVSPRLLPPFSFASVSAHDSASESLRVAPLTVQAPPYAGAGSSAVPAPVAPSLPPYAGYGSADTAPASSPPAPPPPPPLLLQSANSAPKLSVFEGAEGEGGIFFGGGTRPRVVRVLRRKHEPRYRGKDDGDSFWTALRLLFERRLHVPAAALKGEVAWLAVLDSAAHRGPRGITSSGERPSHTLLEHLAEPFTPREVLATVLGDTTTAELEVLRGSLLRSNPPPPLPRALQSASDAAILQQFESSSFALDLGGSLRAIDAFVLAAASRRFYHLPMNTARVCAAGAAGARCSFAAAPLDAAGQAVAFGLLPAPGFPLPSPRGPLPSVMGPFASLLGGGLASAASPTVSDGPGWRSGFHALPAAAPPADTPYSGAVPAAAPLPPPLPVPPQLRAEDLVAITARAPDAEAALAPAVLAGRSGVFVLRGSASKGPGAVAITYTLLRAGAAAASPPEVLHALVLPAPGGAGVVVPPSPAPFASLAAVVEAYVHLTEAVVPGTGRVVPRADVLRLLREHPVYGGGGPPATHSHHSYTGPW